VKEIIDNNIQAIRELSNEIHKRDNTIIVVRLIPAVGFSQTYSDYLILQDISPYKLGAAQKVIGGYIGGPRVFDVRAQLLQRDIFILIT